MSLILIAKSRHTFPPREDFEQVEAFDNWLMTGGDLSKHKIFINDDSEAWHQVSIKGLSDDKSILKTKMQWKKKDASI